MAEPLRERCVPLKDEDAFRGIGGYTKWNKKRHRKAVQTEKEQTFDAHAERTEMLSLYSKEDLRFVLSQLDLEFERSLGYDYAYVYEMLGETPSR